MPTALRIRCVAPCLSCGCVSSSQKYRRDRIARDLHDHVIQRLFAVGLALQGTIPRARSPEVQQRLTGCVDDLQEVIQEIRTAIFDLHGSSSGVTRLRQRLDDAVAQFASTELRTSVQYTGPLSVVDAGLAEHAEAVVREAVSNAVRHADAHSLSVNVAVGDECASMSRTTAKAFPTTSPAADCGTFASARRMSAGRSARTRCRAAAPS
jgi:signal transduction histidine kinase